MMCAILMASVELVLSGVIGQTRELSDKPIPWISCEWCVADKEGDVHFPGGWKVRCGERTVEPEECSVRGNVLSDGSGNLFYFDPPRAEFGEVVVSPAGLSCGRKLFRAPRWDMVFHVAPVICTMGFASCGRRYFALDRVKHQVLAWTVGGDSSAVVFSYVHRTEDFRGLAIHPLSGDLLLSDPWPAQRVHRFRHDGSEVVALLQS